ncbi:M23 family metallopeptidase [Nonomuraea composti]|uniref:M23 family metallopeptidase n=1 Tax=Nonomuraea composti TaxID=2720023 RepID=UPI003D18204A
MAAPPSRATAHPAQTPPIPPPTCRPARTPTPTLAPTSRPPEPETSTPQSPSKARRKATSTTWKLLVLTTLILSTTPVPPARASPAAWRWPLDGTPRILRRFTPPPERWLAGHRGIDLAAPANTPVLAAGPGTIRFAGPVGGKGVVTIDHEGGLRTTYLPVTASVHRGQPVMSGTELGVVEPSNHHCEESCLHWGLRRTTTYLNPLQLLGHAPTRLLPFWPPPPDTRTSTPAHTPPGSTTPSAPYSPATTNVPAPTAQAATAAALPAAAATTAATTPATALAPVRPTMCTLVERSAQAAMHTPATPPPSTALTITPALAKQPTTTAPTACATTPCSISTRNLSPRRSTASTVNPSPQGSSASALYLTPRMDTASALNLSSRPNSASSPNLSPRLDSSCSLISTPISTPKGDPPLPPALPCPTAPPEPLPLWQVAFQTLRRSTSSQLAVAVIGLSALMTTLLLITALSRSHRRRRHARPSPHSRTKGQHRRPRRHPRSRNRNRNQNPHPPTTPMPR